MALKANTERTHITGLVSTRAQNSVKLTKAPAVTEKQKGQPSQRGLSLRKRSKIRHGPKSFVIRIVAR